MKRKVIKQANQAFTLTLPIGWVRKNRIDEKSEVEVNEEGKALVVNSGKKIYGGKVKADLTKLNSRNIAIYVTALYAKGVDEIEITSENNISETLMNAVANTIGYALVSQEKSKYVIKDIGGEQSLEIDEIFKRVFQMILMFYSPALEDIFGKEKETEDSLKLRDKEINKFCLYLQRAINKMAYSDPVNGRALFTYSFELEKLGDEIERMWRTNIKYNVKKTPAIKNLAEEVRNGLDEAFYAYFNYQPNFAEKIRIIRDKTREDSLKIRADPITSRFIRHIVKIIEEAADWGHLNIIIKTNAE